MSGALSGPADPLGDDEMPVYVNPAALHTVQELRAALDSTNLMLARSQVRADRLAESLRDLAEEIAPVVVAYIKDDPECLAQAVRTFVDRRCVVKEGCRQRQLN